MSDYDKKQKKAEKQKVKAEKAKKLSKIMPGEMINDLKHNRPDQAPLIKDNEVALIEAQKASTEEEKKVKGADVQTKSFSEGQIVKLGEVGAVPRIKLSTTASTTKADVKITVKTVGMKKGKKRSEIEKERDTAFCDTLNAIKDPTNPVAIDELENAINKEWAGYVGFDVDNINLGDLDDMAQQLIVVPTEGTYDVVDIDTPFTIPIGTIVFTSAGQTVCDREFHVADAFTGLEDLYPKEDSDDQPLLNLNAKKLQVVKPKYSYKAIYHYPIKAKKDNEGMLYAIVELTNYVKGDDYAKV